MTLSQLYNVLSIWHQGNSPVNYIFQTGRQPYDGGDKLNPTVLNVNVILAPDDFGVVEVSDPQIVIPRRLIVQAGIPPAEVDNPPFDSSKSEIRYVSEWAWIPARDQPLNVVTGKLNPSALNVLYDKPPQAVNFSIEEIADPLPTLPQKIAAFFSVEVQRDFVPRAARMLVATVAAWVPLELPVLAGPKLVQQGVVAQVDYPPPSSSANYHLVISEWPIGWDLPILPPKFTPESVRYDNPPIRTGAKEQLAAGGLWPIGWALPIVGPKLVPGSVDEPAHTSVVRQALAIEQWPRGWDLPILPPRLTPESRDNPPVTSRTWQVDIAIYPSGWTLPIVGPKLVQPAAAAEVNEPPYDMRRGVNLFTAVNISWPIGWALPVVTGKLNPSSLHVRYDNPPFSHRGRNPRTDTAIGSWPIGWTPPLVKPPVIRDEPPTVVGQVNDYIVTFGRRRGRR